MISRSEALKEIMTELVEFTAQTKDDQAVKALDQVYGRMEEACNYLDRGKDEAGKEVTTRQVGEYLLKTWRMTADRNLNKILIRKMAKHYRKITLVFDKIAKLAEEILSYDYKNLKEAEDRTPKILAVLKEGVGAFKVAGEREEDQEKADFLKELSLSYHLLALEIYTGKDRDKSLVAFQDISEKATEIQEQLESIEWDSYISNPLKNPTYVLKENTNKYIEAMDCYVVKKFSVKKQATADQEQDKSEKMKEDAVHMEFGSRKPRQKKAIASPAAKLGKKKKIGGGTGSKALGKRGTTDFYDRHKLSQNKEQKAFTPQRKAVPAPDGEVPDTSIILDQVDLPPSAQEEMEPEAPAAVILQPETAKPVEIPEMQPVPETEPPIAAPLVETPQPETVFSPPLKETASVFKPTKPRTEIEPVPEQPSANVVRPIMPPPLTPLGFDMKRPPDGKVEPPPAPPQPTKYPPAREELSPVMEQPHRPEIPREEPVSTSEVTEQEVTPVVKEKKKGCLPFMIGMSGFLALIIYLITLLFK